jgi:hypothetical protein
VEAITPCVSGSTFVQCPIIHHLSGNLKRFTDVTFSAVIRRGEGHTGRADRLDHAGDGVVRRR